MAWKGSHDSQKKSKRNERMRAMFKECYPVPFIIERFGVCRQRVYQICTGVKKEKFYK